MNKGLNIFFIFMMMLFCSSCLKETNQPQEPLWGKESCARCRMILSDKRFAVQRILSTGEIHYYDDMNCALKHDLSNDQGILYVRPHEGNKWVLANEAKYVSGLMTPMNSGFGAVTDGGTISFEEVKREILKE